MSEQTPARQPYQRRLRNFLLDWRFQAKFAGYFVVITLVVAGLIGFFLWNTTNSLFEQMNAAVDARSKAAETSKELGVCAINNDLAKNMDDPEFAKKLEERSKAIDSAFDNEMKGVLQQRTELVQQQKITALMLIGGLLGFIFIIAAVAIVLTHRIVGPLFRVKRMAREVAGGTIRPPEYGLRPGDELREVFDAMAHMVVELRKRAESDLKAVEAGLTGDRGSLEKLKAEMQGRL